MEHKYPWADWQFEVHPYYTENWPDTGGVYIFARSIPDMPEALVDPHTTWEALYIGKATSIKTRFDGGHEKWDDALDLGFTHVHILWVDDSESELRKSIEALLIDRYQPPLNVQWK